MLIEQEKRLRRHKRVRAKVKGTPDVPRLCVFKSANHIYAQVIDDESGKVLACASDLKIKEKGNKTSLAQKVGQMVAKDSLAKKIEKIVFDRGGYKYHGRVKALAEGAREGGLKF